MITIQITDHEFGMIIEALYGEAANRIEQSRKWEQLGSYGMAEVFDNDAYEYDKLIAKLKSARVR